MERRSEGILIPNGGYAVNAKYTEQKLSDYKNNPLIEALPPILSFEQAEELLHVYPDYDDKERELEPHHRYHCVQRLFKYFQPWDRHFDIEQRISRVIRQGYISRNPLKANYAADMQQIYQMIKEGNYKFDNCELSPMKASGFTVIGFSGVGKSTAIERVLSLYPQIILHSKYKNEDFSHYQLTWLKLDCPYDGSVKGLCANFFMEIDRLIGENTYNKFASGRNTTTDTMIPRMAQIARRHSLGVLVIDEIQHLSAAKSGGSEKMLNFFVTLVNKIGVPVILIGTSKAISILQSEFRQARRGSGQQGDMVWENMSKDSCWELLIEGLWEYQWTKKKINLTDEIDNALYEESQGIVDIAVKLYAMAQMRAIASGEETINAETIHKVAKDNLQLVRPMLLALKSGDKKEIGKYEDIRPIDLDAFCEKHYSMLVSNEVLRQRKLNERKRNNGKKIEDEAISILIEHGVKSEKAKALTREIIEETNESKDAQDIVKLALRKILSEQDEKKLQRKNKGTDRKYELKESDLRHIIEEGKRNCISAYESLKNKGVIKSPVEEFIMLG